MIYTRDKFIKAGSYGKVWIGRDNTNNPVALKEFMYEHVVAGFNSLRELDILSKLSKSIFVPKLIDIEVKNYDYLRNQKNKIDLLVLVTELADIDGESFF